MLARSFRQGAQTRALHDLLESPRVKGSVDVGGVELCASMNRLRGRSVQLVEASARLKSGCLAA